MVKNVINEVINDYLKENIMLKEYKNPNDSETIRVCCDMLEKLYEDIISNGTSKNEYTVQHLHKIVNELRKLQETIR